MKTIAEQIVERFFGDSPDGQEWPESDSPGGIIQPGSEEGFAKALENRAVCPPYHPVREDGTPGNGLIYEMEDGSCIVESNGAWDYGYTDTNCGCWASQPHHCGQGEG